MGQSYFFSEGTFTLSIKVEANIKENNCGRKGKHSSVNGLTAYPPFTR